MGLATLQKVFGGFNGAELLVAQGLGKLPHRQVMQGGLGKGSRHTGYLLIR
jgi:hypothetical protein